MKILFTCLLVLSFTCAFAHDTEARFEMMSSFGDKEITFGTLFSPPGLGAVRRAKMRAKKVLKEKCATEFSGKIKGKIIYKKITLSKGDMTAHVAATGECHF